MRRIPAITAAVVLALATTTRADFAIDLGDGAKLEMNDRGVVTGLVFGDGERWPAADQPAVALEGGSGVRTPIAVELQGDRLVARFEDGSRVELTVKRQSGTALFRLTKLDAKAPVDRLRLFRLAVPPGATIGGTLNSAHGEKHVAAVMTAEINVLGYPERPAAPASPTLNAASYRAHGLEPAAFGVVTASPSEFMAAVERFETLAGIPSPRLDGVWNKVSPAIKRSYFFLTGFKESQFDEALAIARRGGFERILLLQDSWSTGTGHYDVNRENFPDGLEGLKRTFDRFRAEGFKVGLHFLGASIYPPDPYITPVPDPRLVLGAKTTLAADVDEAAGFIPVDASPDAFPAEDGGYMGKGTVIRVGDELIAYGARKLEAPFGFAKCVRGHLGTKVSAHKKGERVAHLVRSYGYHMYDMDTTLLDEVAANFAKVADAVGADMVYFDGSEDLQGDHWYYNAKLHKAFYDHLGKKDVLLQASSYSPYSWHLMARSASADGHGDLKGYLDQRSPWFDSMGRDGMPLDVGWYYGYDPNSTLDQYEYVLGATVGYDSSMSYQVSPAAASAHPFTEDVLNLVARYEKLRLSGRVDDAMRARLRIDPALGGSPPPGENDGRLEKRREYRLLGPEGKEAFQRVLYQPWRVLKNAEDAAQPWTVKVADAPAKVGFWVHAQPGPWLTAGPSYLAADAITLETFDDPAAFPANAGSTLQGVEQRLEFRDDDAREGKGYAVYTAKSDRKDAGGWSVIGHAFNPPLDLSKHKGIGFWLKGDGKGGSFKLQLLDGKGATDYYVVNDFEGWRYQQLARPEKDPIDYHNVRHLNVYYNGLPGETAVSCGVDGVKALNSLDAQTLTDPWIEIDGRRLTWSGTLSAGQYLVWWPGEPVGRFGPPLKSPERGAKATETVVLQPGEHAIRFGCEGTLAVPARVRLTLQPPERHAVGEKR